MAAIGKRPLRSRQRPEAVISARRRDEQEVLRKIRVIFSSVKKHFRAVEERCGVSGAQLWALIELRDHPGLRVSEVAKAMAVHLSTASNLLDKLEARGLIRRDRSDRDQRVVRIFLTPQGESIVAKAPRPARGVVPDALERMPAATLRGLALGLDELISRLQVRDANAVAKPLSDI